jgi:hypothetical protein
MRRLRQDLQSSGGGVRLAAAVELLRMGDRSGVSIAIETLDNEYVHILPFTPLSALCEHLTPEELGEAIPRLVTVLRSTNYAEVVSRIATALGGLQHSGADAVDALIDVIDGGPDKLRPHLSSGHGARGPVLAPRYHFTGTMACEHVIAALSTIATERAIEALRRIAEEPTSPLRGAARSALQKHAGRGKA